MEKKIVIRPLAPELAEDYFDFFDNRAFSDGSPFFPCYCNAFNMPLEQFQKEVLVKAKEYGGAEGWQRALRESAYRMVLNGEIRGYLAYDGDLAIERCIIVSVRSIFRRRLRTVRRSIARVKGTSRRSFVLRSLRNTVGWASPVCC